MPSFPQEEETENFLLRFECVLASGSLVPNWFPFYWGSCQGLYLNLVDTLCNQTKVENICLKMETCL